MVSPEQFAESRRIQPKTTPLMLGTNSIIGVATSKDE
jgi:hypothetical protein